MAVIVPLPTRARTGSALQKSKSNIVKAHRKKWVLSLRLNELTVSASRTAAGILFHTTGPATEKALSPNFVLVRGTSGHCRVWIVNIRARLNLILYTTGNQWSSFRAERTWSRRDNPISRRAAAFCTCCSGAMVDGGRPLMMTLQ